MRTRFSFLLLSTLVLWRKKSSISSKNHPIVYRWLGFKKVIFSFFFNTRRAHTSSDQLISHLPPCGRTNDLFVTIGQESKHVIISSHGYKSRTFMSLCNRSHTSSALVLQLKKIGLTLDCTTMLFLLVIFCKLVVLTSGKR